MAGAAGTTDVADAAVPTDPAAAAARVAALRRWLQARHGEVPLIETHISWVLLAGEHAYKLKKPVRFGFLDFTTAALRHRFCCEELRLNRRMAPALYLRVVPIHDGPRGPSLHGRGPVVDYAVKMRRMAPNALASERLAQGLLVPSDLEAFGRRLAAFHSQAPAAAAGSSFGSQERVRDDALHVIDALAAQAAPAASELAAAVAALRAWFVQQSLVLGPRWQQRQAQGHVRDGHGDLHLDNVLLQGHEVTAFDCIEFDPALRWIDVMNDAGFLMMDLLAHGRSDLAFAFLDAYLESSGDHGGLDVLRFYLVYRAVVRALVTRLRGGPVSLAVAAVGATGADAYLTLALRLTQPAPAALLITHGLPASGKSWVAKALTRAAAAVRLRSDVERKRLAGLPALADSKPLGDLYTTTATDTTYQHLAQLARQTLAAGWPVIVDAAFLRRDQRDTFRALATEAGVPFAIADCQAPLAVLRQRIHQRRARRDDPSEADESVLARLDAQQQPLAEDERVYTLVVPTDAPIDLPALIGAWQGPQS